MGWEPLIDAAKGVLKNAYAPYSNIHVAAAVSTDKGIFTGVNVENASYGLSMCAERVAVFSAISGGAKELYSIVVLTDQKGLLPPCGACRQVLAEFNPNMEILLVNTAGALKETSLDKLLTEPFLPKHLTDSEV